MLNEKCFIGLPEAFEDICLIYPPTIGDILGVSFKEFSIYLKILTLSQEDIDDDIEKAKSEGKEILRITPFEYLFQASMGLQSEKFLERLERAFLFFTRETITLAPKAKIIILGKITENRLLTEDNYFQFQNLIRESCGFKAIEPYDPNESPKVAAFKAKQRYRDKVKANQRSGEGGLDFRSTLPILCAIEMGITPFNIGNLTYAASNMLISTYQNKDKYQTDIRTLQAGGDSKKIKPKYWMKNLDDN